MKLYRTWIVSALVLLAGCSAPTAPTLDDGPATYNLEVRGSTAPTQSTASGGGFGSGTTTSGNLFGSGTITGAPSLDPTITDSTGTSVNRGNMFGSGT